MKPNWDSFKLPTTIALIAIIILTVFIGKKHGYTVDANASFAITKEIVITGNWFPETAVKQGYLYSVIYIPFFILASPVQTVFPNIPLEYMQRKMLCWMNTFFTGLTAAVLCCLLRTLGYSRIIQTLLPLIYAVSTLAFTYARYDYNKSVATFFLITTFFYLIQYLKEPERINMWLCGIFLAFLICIRLEMAVVILPFIYVLSSSKQWKAVAYLCIPFLLALSFVIGYNSMYWQADLSGGYEGSFATNPFPAIAGVLFSPGKSLLVFNPILILMPLTMRFFWHNQSKPVFTVWASTVALLFMLYCFWGNWWGGWGYGARHFMPLIPLLILPLAECFSGEGKRLLIPLIVLTAIGVFVQIAGAAIAFHDVIHTLMQSGFSEQQLIWEPQLNPIIQHIRFMQAIPFSNWDFAISSFVQQYSVTITIPVIGMVVFVVLALSVWLYRNCKQEHEPTA